MPDKMRTSYHSMLCYILELYDSLVGAGDPSYVIAALPMPWTVKRDNWCNQGGRVAEQERESVGYVRLSTLS